MSVSPEEMAPMSLGMASVEDDPAAQRAKIQEEANAKRWLEKISKGRKFDEGARKQYALDRSYAQRRKRGADGVGFEVDVPIAGSYVDVLKSFLYARDPDVDVLPAESTEPPPQDELVRMAKQALGSDPMVKEQLIAAHDQAFQASNQKKQVLVQAVAPTAAKAVNDGNIQGLPNLPDLDPDKDAEAATRAAMDKLIRSKVRELGQPYQQRRDDAKQFGQTLEIVISQLWKKAKLKAKAKPQVGSSLTVGIGWLKATWQERTGEDPLIKGQIADILDNLQRLAVTKKTLEDGDAPDVDQATEDYQQQLKGLQSQVEVVVARGLAIDFVAAEDIQVSPECGTMSSYLDAPWIAHRMFMTCEAAKAALPLLGDKMKAATTYGQVKPADPNVSNNTLDTNVQANAADSYRQGSAGGAIADGDSVCVWEVWDKDTNQVYTFVEGVNAYAREPYAPDPATTRFYPFFQFSIGDVDGQRHPESLINRSGPLLDEYDRVRSGYAEHRRRVIPKTAFDKTNLSDEEAARLEAGGRQEMVGLKPMRPGTPMSELLAPVAYAQIDQALYDTSVIRAELETIWGIQEALSSSIQTAKTATEAEIQQTGTNARTGYMRDGLDAMMGELAEYTAEIAVQKLSTDDVKELAGPWAFWPEGMKIEDLGSLVTVDIRAGSSGKPDTTRQRQAWATVMPVLQNAILQVGQLRGSAPQDVADSIEALIEETLQRTGDRLEASRFLPAAPDPDDTPGASPSMPQPMAPTNPTMGAPTGALAPAPLPADNEDMTDAAA